MTPTTTATFLKSIRQYFWTKNFSEVEIPYLNKSLPLESNIYLFQTQDYFLPPSPEFALKKFLSESKQNCFAISHCFRDLEASNDLHTPEFLMLEWYEINKNLNDLKKSTKDFLNYLYGEVLCLPLLSFTEIKLPDANFDNEPDFNQYFLNNIEPNLPKNKAVFITGYPSFLSPLALPNQRFELYINGIEIANGCEENTDSKSILESFKSEQQYRHDHNLPTHPYSLEFVKIISNLPPCSGIGLGIDRLLKIINSCNISP